MHIIHIAYCLKKTFTTFSAVISNKLVQHTIHMFTYKHRSDTRLKSRETYYNNIQQHMGDKDPMSVVTIQLNES